MKYVFDLEKINSDSFSSNSSQRKILKQIKPNSSVLECGCAIGYMTKYMTEILNCSVSIIEYEQEAFDIAKKYASDGLCADLTENAWVEYYSGRKFDYILFADVLEHLYDPSSVLQKATQFLSDEGTILVSLPNIGHNDIITKLFNSHWEYTSTGLLDDTHIRFWGRHNLDAFFKKAGLHITRKDYVFIPTYKTEQAKNMPYPFNSQLHELLSLRSDGEVYQFIVTAQKSNSGNTVIPAIDLLEQSLSESTLNISQETITNVLEANYYKEYYKNQLAHYERAYNSIISSHSWKITKPLRAFMKLLKKLRHTNCS